MRLSLLLIALLFFASCAPSIYTRSMKDQEGITWRSYQGTNEEVFQAVLMQLQKGEEAILVADKELGIITTDWIENTSLRDQILMGGQRRRTNFNVYQSSQTGFTDVKVNLSIQQRTQDDTGWEEMAVTARIAERSIPAILDRIGAELEIVKRR